MKIKAAVKKTVGEIRWNTFEIALNQFKKFQLKQLN